MKVREIVPLIAENNDGSMVLAFDGYWCGYNFSMEWFNNPEVETDTGRYIAECLDREVDRLTTDEDGRISIVVRLA